MAGENEFLENAARLAVQELESNLIQATREFEDAQRSGDEVSAAYALKNYNAAELEYNKLTGAGQQRQQQPGQLTPAQMNFLSRRAALGDDLTPARMKDFHLGHVRAVNAGLTVNSPEYFAVIAKYADTMTGDGHQPVLDERSAAKICGITDEEYAAGAAKLRALKNAGHYQD